jgi:hypothetical protein
LVVIAVGKGDSSALAVKKTIIGRTHESSLARFKYPEPADTIRIMTLRCEFRTEDTTNVPLKW